MPGDPPVREPNFFLVGASRAGTTSLWHYLVEHPQVYMPWRSGAEKEPSHFCDVTPSWAGRYRERDRYLALFREATDAHVAIGEASTPYLVAPEAPARIRRAYPHAKIIIVLRNPAERAHSLYRFLCLIGAEWAPTFEKALALEPARMSDERFTRSNRVWYGLFQYFNSGLYSSQVARYLDAFPREQVEIILYDDLKADSAGTARRVYRFLGVDPAFTPRAKRYNASRFPLSVWLQYWLASNMDRSIAGRMGGVRGRLFEANGRFGAWRNDGFHADTRRRLLDGYRDDIAKTAALIARRLDPWLEGHG
jgi:hypothetical protein